MKQPSEVPNEKTTIEPEATSISEVANPQPSTEPSTVNIKSTAQLKSNDHVTMQQRRQQRRQQPPSPEREISNHVESNQISKETIAKEMSKLLIEDKTKAAIENINRSALISTPASKSSSQIYQKLRYAEHYADGNFDVEKKLKERIVRIFSFI